MSGRRAHSLPPHMMESKPERGKCVTAICFSWKVITCIVSHVTLVLMVVSYCVGGAYLFQHLEKPHEIEIKMDIHNMRRNLTERIWRFSDNVSYLYENDWIIGVRKDLANFEKQILTAMKADGWDGDEDITKTQWTFAGSLFYSIIVITTIGYGHISPRTDWGKVTTIFYAIVGIPLMLLCLSNIGDIMATSFRFVYWRVCCYVCTRTSKRSRRQSRQRSVRSQRYSTRSQPPMYRRSMRLTQRSGNDSGIGTSIGGVPHAYSDPELRNYGHPKDYELERRNGGSRRNTRASTRHNAIPPYENDPYADEIDPRRHYRSQSQRINERQKNRNRMQERHTVERERHVGRSRQYFNSNEDLSVTPPTPPPPLPASMAKRSFSVRSMRSPNTRRNELDPVGRRDERETREYRELNRLNSQTLPRGRSMPRATGRGRAKSVDPRILHNAQYDDLDEEIIQKTPIIPNRYALEEFDHRELHPKRSNLRSQSMPRSAHQQRGGGGGGGGGNAAGNYINSREADYNREDSPPHHQGYSNRRHQQQQQQQFDERQQRSPRHARNQPQSNQRVPHLRYGNHLELPEFTTHNMNNTRRGRSRSPRPSDDYRSTSVTPNMNHVRRGHSPRPSSDYDDAAYDERYPDEYDVEAGYRDYSAHDSRHRERRHQQQRRERSGKLPPSPRIMSPMGFAVKRQVRRRPSYDYDDDSMNEDWVDYYGALSPKNRPVPIWLCVFLVISYILGGAALFAHWEHWSFLDSAYFCFITLTTIGFGDFVPAKGVQDESEQSIAYCSLYLLFGISLLAMSFNLVQEEFIANVKEVARRLGILKDDEDDEDD